MLNLTRGFLLTTAMLLTLSFPLISIPPVSALGELARVRIGTTPVGVGVDPTTNTVFASAYSSNNVSVLNGITGQVIATVNIVLPIGIGVNILTDTIYVVHGPVGATGALSVIDGTTDTITADVLVGTNPQYVGLDPSTSKAYVTNAGSNTVSVLDISGSPPSVTNTIVVGAYPLGVAVNPNTHQVYVANANSGTVSVINGSATPPSVTTTITIGSTPFGIGVDPVTNRIYVANHGSSTVSIIDGSAIPPSVTSTFSVASPVGLALNSVAKEMYVVNDGANTVTIFDISATPPLNIGSVNVGSTSVGIGYGVGGVGVNPSIRRIYVSNYGENTISFIDVSNPPLGGTIVPFDNPGLPSYYYGLFSVVSAVLIFSAILFAKRFRHQISEL